MEIIKTSEENLNLHRLTKIVSVLAVLFVLSVYNFLLFHILAEMINVIIALGIFMVVWNSRKFHDNTFLLFIGITYLFIGGLDLLHTVSHPELGILQGDGENPPQQIRTASRILEALAFAIAFFFVGRKRKVGATTIFLSFFTVCTLIYLLIYPWHIFPQAYSPISGSTPFKNLGDYVSCALFLVAFYLLIRKKEIFSPTAFFFFSLTIIFKAVSVLIHTPFVDTYSFVNYLSHSLRFISFYFLYKAMVEGTLMHPYEVMFGNLIKSQEKLKRAHDELELKVRQRTAELEDTNVKLEKEKKYLLESYKLLGVTNRKISFLLEMYSFQQRPVKKGKAMDYILATAVNFTGALTGILYRYDEKESRLFMLRSKNMSTDQEKKIRSVAIDPDSPLEILVRDFQRLQGDAEERKLEMLKNDDVSKHFIMLPLGINRRLLGAILLTFQNKEVLDSLDLDFCDIFSLYASQILLNTNIFK